jgi:hypothetical protein
VVVIFFRVFFILKYIKIKKIIFNINILKWYKNTKNLLILNKKN